MDERSVYLSRHPGSARNWPVWKRCRSTKTRSSCRCPTQQGGRRLDGLSAQHSIARRSDSQWLLPAARSSKSTSTRKRSQAESKYTPLHKVEGKKVILVEVSIVRSTTMNVLLKRIGELGRAKEIHVRIACPPIIAPCFYGIDMSTIGQLFAQKSWKTACLPKKAKRRWPRSSGADSSYLPVESIAKAVDLTAKLPRLHHRQVPDPLRSGTVPNRGERRLQRQRKQGLRNPRGVDDANGGLIVGPYCRTS